MVYGAGMKKIVLADGAVPLVLAMPQMYMKRLRKYLHDRYASFLARHGWLRPEDRVSEIIFRVTEAVKALMADQQFRAFIHWETRGEADQDFVFNEVAAMAFCETRVTIVESLPGMFAKERAFWRDAAEALFPAFLDMLRRSDIPEDRVRGWGELLTTREEESLQAQEMVSDELATQLRQVHPLKREPMRRVLAMSSLLHFQIAKHLDLQPNPDMSSLMSAWMIDLDNAMRAAMR